MRWRPFRITAVWAKVAYVAIYVIGVLVMSYWVAVGGASPVAFLLFRTVTDTAVILLGVRSFRASGEPVLPERPWWKATGRPLAGFVIAAFWALTIAVSIPWLLTDLTPGQVVLDALGTLTSAAYGIFYLHSSLRLRQERPGRRWVSRKRSPDL